MSGIPKNQVRSRNTIEQHEHEDAASARRIVPVSPDGKLIDVDNPLPVKLSDVLVVESNLSVQLTDKDDDPNVGAKHDSVRIGNGVNEVDINSNKQLEVQDLRNLIQNIVNTSKFLALSNFDKVIPEFSGNSVLMKYYEDDVLIGEANFNYTDALNWDLSTFAYVNNDDGSLIQNDDDSFLLLE